MRRMPVLGFLLALCAGAAGAADYRAPRTSHGHPDLQGIWTNTSSTWLQRPPNVKSLVVTEPEAAAIEAGFRRMVDPLISEAPIDPAAPAPPVVKSVENADFLEMDLRLARVRGEIRTSWIVEPADGRIPFTDAGRKANRERDRDGYDGPEARPLTERCLLAIGTPEGPPMMNTGFNGHYQIVQTRDHVAIHIEMNHDVRIVRLADRARPHDAVRPWMGDSVGWWEGETLVIETTNFHPLGKVSSMTGGFAHGPRTRIVERLTRTADDSLLYAFTVEDPDYFTTPWRGEMPMRAASGPIYEYACHEGNYSLANALSGARVEEQAAGPAPR